MQVPTPQSNKTQAEEFSADISSVQQKLVEATSSMKLGTLATNEFIRNGICIWHALAAGVHPHTAYITRDHALTIINSCPTSATYNPILKTPCNAANQSLSALAIGLQIHATKRKNISIDQLLCVRTGASCTKVALCNRGTEQGLVHAKIL